MNALVVNQQLNRLIGHVSDNDVFLLNGEIVEALCPFNIYVMSSEFYDEYHKSGFDDDQVTMLTFVYWLETRGIIRTLTASQAGLVSSLEHYRTFPYVPSYKDIMWVTRVLKQQLQELSPRDVYLLAIYREMEIEGRDVEKEIVSRNIATVKSLIQVLEQAYRSHLELHINSSDKETCDESRTSRIPLT